MKELGILMTGVVLMGAGCSAVFSPPQQTGGMIAPYSTQAQSDVGTPIVPYQEGSDLSRIAKMEAQEKTALKDEFKTQEEEEPVEAVATVEKPEITEESNIKPMPTWKFPGALPAAEREGKHAVIETSKGTIEFEIFGTEAPLASSNFIYLSKGGFYDGLTFHRREEGFVIQGGDPRGNGTGGPGYQFEDEKVTRPYSRGIVAMANAGRNTNGSQFFIMLDDVGLPPNYTIFGKVTKGIEVVDTIAVGDKMTKVTIK